MAEDTSKKPTKSKNGESNLKITIAFFAIIIVVIIVCTILFLNRNTSTIYTTSYGEDSAFRVSIEVFSNNKIDLAIDIGQQQRIIQSGTYEEDKDTPNGYIITIVDKSDPNNPIESKMNMTIEEDVLKLIYPDGSFITLNKYEPPKEDETNSGTTTSTNFNKESDK